MAKTIKAAKIGEGRRGSLEEVTDKFIAENIWDVKQEDDWNSCQ